MRLSFRGLAEQHPEPHLDFPSSVLPKVHHIIRMLFAAATQAHNGIGVPRWSEGRKKVRRDDGGGKQGRT